MFMILYGVDFSSMNSSIEGNFFFFANCSATAMYVLITKPLIATGKYHSLVVTAVSYMFCAVIMAISYVVIAQFPPVLTFLCPDCTGILHIYSHTLCVCVCL